MDDPNIIPNSTSLVVDPTDSMTSLSPSKRTIALGVVNTSGMKSVNMNRKRRWDQPPDESGDTPCVKKVHLNELSESPDCSERLSDESVEMSDKCDELDNSVPHSEQFVSDGNAMSIDLPPPDEVCDRLSLPETPSVSPSSEHKKCESTVPVCLAECSESDSVEKVNSSSSDLRLGSKDVDKETDPSNPVSENPVVTSIEKKSKSSTVISHQSDELRRIMFSYNEGSSESDSNDSNALPANPGSSDNKTDKEIPGLGNCEDISKLGSSVKNNEPNIKSCALVNENRLVPEENENSLADKNLPIQSQNADSNSCNDVDSIEMPESSITAKTESHLNIPNKHDLPLNMTEVNCVDNLLSETNNTQKCDISSVNCEEVYKINKYIDDEEARKQNIGCRKSPEINTCEVEADSTRICEDEVVENCNQVIKNVPVVSVTQQLLVDSLSDSIKENEDLVPQVNNVGTERIMEISESDRLEGPEGVSSAPADSTSSSNLDVTVYDKAESEDIQETEQLCNLHSIKENSIEINESCLDDVNSSTLKPELDLVNNEVISDIESASHTETVNDISRTSLESTNIDNSNLKNCSILNEAVGNKILSECEIVPDSNQSMSFNKISEKSSENEIVNKINEKVDSKKDVLPSNSIASDVMKVIPCSTDGSSKDVKDEESTVAPTSPEAESNQTMSTSLAETQNNQQDGNESQSMGCTLDGRINEVIETSGHGSDDPDSAQGDSNDGTSCLEDKGVMEVTPSENLMEQESMITEDDLVEVKENVPTNQVLIDDTPNDEVDPSNKPHETLSPKTDNTNTSEVELKDKLGLGESEADTNNEVEDSTVAENSIDEISANICVATDVKENITKNSVVCEAIEDEKKLIYKTSSIVSEPSEDKEKLIDKSSAVICEVEEKGIDKTSVIVCEGNEMSQSSAVISETREVIEKEIDDTITVIGETKGVEEKLIDDIVCMDKTLNVEEEIIDKPLENVLTETDNGKGDLTELKGETDLQDVEVPDAEMEVLDECLDISEREKVKPTELNETSNLSTTSEKNSIIVCSESLLEHGIMDASSTTEDSICEANNVDSDSIRPSDIPNIENKSEVDETVVDRLPDSEIKSTESKNTISVKETDGTTEGIPDEIEEEKIDNIKSPDISQETIVNNNEGNGKVLTEEIETFDVVEEVVTCETSCSDKVVGGEIDEVVNEDENAQFASEGTQESIESSDDLVAVMDNDTSDIKVSDNDNQNEIIGTEVYIKAEVNPSSEKEILVENEVISNSIGNEMPMEKMECETSVNSIITCQVSKVEEMEVDEVPEIDSSLVVKEVNDIPLLKTVSCLRKQNKDNTTSLKEEISDLLPKTPTKEGIIPPLEPITLKIYKDNLSVKTDELTSPKKHKSPKLSSDSPRSKIDTANMSPQNKQFEYTLKIAKDANTNIPKATMSPKSSMSPSWKLESSSLSPQSPGESGVGSLKIKLSKPSPSRLSNDLSHSVQNVKQEEIEIDIKSEECTVLPKPALEMGSALKLMMEVDTGRTEGGSSILEKVLSGSADSLSLGGNRKVRGRPRKENELNHSPTPGETGGEDGAEDVKAADSPALDTSGEGSEAGSSRHVRSCRARTQPIAPKSRKPRGGGVAGTATPRGGGRGGARGVARPIATAEEAEKIQEKLSEKEKAELAKIEARKEKMRLDRIAKSEAKKAKKLAKKLKDEERRKRLAAEKAEKAAAAAPQVFEEETRMSASESRGHTPAPQSRVLPPCEGIEESQNSLGTTSTPKPGNHKGRMEIPIDPESDEVRVDQLAEYQWQGSELCMIQEQVSLYLGVKSFKRKYPDLRRRLVEAEERTFLEDSGLVPKSMCDLGLTAVSSAEILDIMFQDFPDKYEAFRQYVRDKQAKEMSFKQKALASQTQNARAKGELRELALEAAAMWNSNLNRERREERRCTLDLQTLTVNYPKYERERMVRCPLRPGLYPVSVIPGQFSDYYKTYTPTELMYFPLNTVMYGPLKPNQRRDGSDSSSSSSDDSSGTSDSEKDSEDEEGVAKECKICNGEKKSSHEAHPEILLQCSQCKGLCHPTCQEITPEMLPHIKKYSWHCSNCKKCTQCKDASKEEKMLFCDLCDRGYHISCVGLRKSPEGRWHCSVCSFCTLCGSKDPGGQEWYYEYKKTDKGVRLYQRTLCAPCSKVSSR